MFEKIKKWYILGLWTGAMVQMAAEKNLLTGEEVTRILERKET